MACEARAARCGAARAPAAPTDRAQASARTVIVRRIIAASLWGNAVIQPHQSLVVRVLAEPLARSAERLGAALGAQPPGSATARTGRPSTPTGRSRAASPSSPTISGSPPRSEARTGTPAASASSTEYGHGSSQRDGASTTAARRRRSARSPRGPSRPVKRTSAPAASAPQARLVGPGAGDHERDAGAPRAAAIAVSNPFSSVRRPAARANSPSAAARLRRRTRRLGMKLGNVAVNEGGSPKSRRCAASASLTATNWSTCSNSRGCWRAQRGRVHGGLGQRATAAQAQPRARVPSPAAEARRAVAVGDADRAEQPVVVQVEHGAGAGPAGGGQGTPAEQRMDVVRVDDPYAAPAHDRSDLAGLDPAREQTDRRPAPAELPGSSARAPRPRGRVGPAAPRGRPPHAPPRRPRGSGCGG